MSETVIKIEKLWKRYGLPLPKFVRSGQYWLKQLITLRNRQISNLEKNDNRSFALKDISLEVKQGETIGINFDDSGEIKAGRLVNVQKDFFSVLSTEKDLLYSFPIRNILSIMEALNDAGISLKGGDIKYAAVIRVMQQGT